ncbi:MAG: hypothetical protein KDC75_02155, partial [Phaeodactylibacter sp.]|nr:hypothetical protein [Phaeodactylibacter sp.]
MVNGLNNNDRYAVAGARLRYPRTPSLGGSGFLSFSLPAGSNSRYLELEGLGGSAPAIILDLSKGQRLAMQQEGNLWKAKLPAAAGERQLAVARTFNTISTLAPENFTDYENTAADFLIISNRQLYDDGQGNNWVQEYADYRRSAAGGGHSVAMVEVEELYDQFAYGLNRHPLSIRNFVNYVAGTWPGLKYCFIIGKGQEYQLMRTAVALQAAVAEGRMLVPSFGFPASDNLLLSNNYTSVPVVPVGRLAATDGRKVKIYLDKVQAVEANRDNSQTIADRAWMKQVVHLGGGGTSIEQRDIRTALETMARDLENNTFGASVRSFYKTSTDPIQTSLSEQIFNTINQGTSILTFMGHSSPGTFDFNIDNPDNYSNYAKYPLMLSLGCYSGNIFTTGESIGERFIFYENRAAVAFGASRGVGYISSLGAFARSFYGHIGGDYYGQGIGDALRATLADYDQNPFFGTATLVEQFTLQGDPSIRLHPAPGPDFVVDPALVQFEPRVVTVQQDSFSLTFDALNLGRNDKDTFTVEIRQQFPGGNTVEVIRDTVAAPAFRSTYTYRIPVKGKESVGLNTFFIRLDADNEVAELPAPAAELNNELVRSNGEPGATLFIVDNTARPVYPPDFALVGETPITLKASTTDALAPERTYLLEIDTTALFDSPLKRQTAIRQRGGVIKWTPTLSWQDSTVYYWRISPDSTEVEVGYSWEQSSFTYIEGSPNGWGQGGYWQFRENEFDDMEFSSVTRSLKFAPTYYNILIKNKVFDSNDRPEFVFNGQPYASPWPWVISAGIQLIVIDSINSDRWMPNPPGGDHGTINGNSVSDVWAFKTDTPEGREAMMNFIEDIIPYGKYVMLYSVQRTIQSDYGAWDWESDTSIFGRSIFDVLEVEGATSVRVLAERGSVPYIFMFQKGKGALSENVANNVSDVIFAECNPSQRWYEGEMVSTPIGPVSSWEEMCVNYEYSKNIYEDSLNIQLLGLKDFVSTPEEIKSFPQPTG